MKKCPHCAEKIQNEAIKCKHCGEALTAKEKPNKSSIMDGVRIGWGMLVVLPIIIILVLLLFGYISLVFLAALEFVETHLVICLIVLVLIGVLFLAKVDKDFRKQLIYYFDKIINWTKEILSRIEKKAK